MLGFAHYSISDHILKIHYPGEEALGKNILWQFLERWPTPEDTIKASWEEMAALIQPLGLHEKRAKMIIRFSGDS